MEKQACLPDRRDFELFKNQRIGFLQKPVQPVKLAPVRARIIDRGNGRDLDDALQVGDVFCMFHMYLRKKQEGHSCPSLFYYIIIRNDSRKISPGKVTPSDHYIEEVSVIPLFGNLLQCAILGAFFESRFDLISQLLFILVHDDDSLIDFEWKELQQQRWQQISEMFS